MADRYIKLDKEGDADYGGGGEGTQTVFLKVADVDYTTDVEFDELEEINRPALEESYQVTRTGGGSFSMWGRADSLPLLLWSLFGHVEEHDIGTTGTAPYRFVYYPDIDNLPSLEITEGKDDKAYPYPGQMIQTMEFTAEMGNVLTIDVNSIGKGCDTPEAKETPTYIDTDDCPVFTLRNATIEIGNTGRTDLRSVTLPYTNNISEDEHTLGDIDFQDKPPAERREVEVNMEFREEDEDLFVDFVNGTEASLEITFQTTKEIETDIHYELKFIIPRLQYRENDMSQSGRDPIRTNVSGRALLDQDVEYQTGESATDTVNAEIVAELIATENGQIVDQST